MWEGGIFVGKNPLENDFITSIIPYACVKITKIMSQFSCLRLCCVFRIGS